jgi:hypothetical protein
MKPVERFMKYEILIPLALVLGLAPFFPRPHLVEKVLMLFRGQLTKPIDIFDLFWHGWPLLLLAWKVVMDLQKKGKGRRGEPGG